MTQSNFKIAITGGIGSGKTTVSKIIARQGFKVVSCDMVYDELLRDKAFVDLIVKEFGDVLDSSGALDRKKLSKIVFAESNALKRLNNITHSAIMKSALLQMSGAGINFCEVPLLFENGFQKLFDNTIVVLRSVEARINSVLERDKISREEVINRISCQYNYEDEDFAKYYVIHNDYDLQYLEYETYKIIKKIIKDYRI